MTNFKEKISEYLLENDYVYEETIKFSNFNFFLGCVFFGLMFISFVVLNIQAQAQWDIQEIIKFSIVCLLFSVLFLAAGLVSAYMLMSFLCFILRIFLGQSFVKVCKENPEMVRWSSECP